MKKQLIINLDIDDAAQEKKYSDVILALMKELEKTYNNEPVKNKIAWTIEDKTA